jgi:cell wall-associated NlpC family hydrolase
MLMEIIKYINTPYKYGGDSQDGIDCSAFTQNVFSSSLDVNLLRSAREQYTQGFTVREKGDLIFGDLVFFNTRRAVRPGHVGIYIGDNLFAHASSTSGVIVSSLDHKYYSTRFMGGRRVNDVFSQN